MKKCQASAAATQTAKTHFSHYAQTEWRIERKSGETTEEKTNIFKINSDKFVHFKKYVKDVFNK